jgi:hypothetical protein
MRHKGQITEIQKKKKIEKSQMDANLLTYNVFIRLDTITELCTWGLSG